MNNKSTSKARSSDLQKDANSVVNDVKSLIRSKFEDCERKVRQSPRKSVLIAVGIGYCINRLPVMALLAVPIRLTTVLAKPGLLLLGAAKLYDIAGKQAHR